MAHKINFDSITHPDGICSACGGTNFSSSCIFSLEERKLEIEESKVAIEKSKVAIEKSKVQSQWFSGKIDPNVNVFAVDELIDDCSSRCFRCSFCNIPDYFLVRRVYRL